MVQKTLKGFSARLIQNSPSAVASKKLEHDYSEEACHDDFVTLMLNIQTLLNKFHSNLVSPSQNKYESAKRDNIALFIFSINYDKCLRIMSNNEE